MGPDHPGPPQLCHESVEEEEEEGIPANSLPPPRGNKLRRVNPGD